MIPKIPKERYLQQIKEFRLMDDEFLTKVFEDNIPCTELVLSIILGRDLKVLEVKTQYNIKNLQGHSVRLDIFALDENGGAMNIEIQRNDRGSSPQRARYNSSLIDANIFDIGEEYGNLPETYVIFITENDVLKGGKPIYHINRHIEEMSKPFGDKSHIIYVNSQIQDETELGKLMHDFYCTDTKDMNYPVLADRVRFFKEETEGVDIMSKAMEKFYAEVVVDTKLDILKGLIADYGIKLVQAMAMLKIPESEQKKYEELLKKN